MKTARLRKIYRFLLKQYEEDGDFRKAWDDFVAELVEKQRYGGNDESKA